MVISEQQRLEMHQGLIAALGEEVAATVMEHLPPVGWADVARRSDVEHLGTTLRLEMQSTESRIEAKLTGIQAELQSMESRIDAKMSGLEARLLGEMSKLTRTFVVAMLAAVFAAVGGSLGGVAALAH